MRVCCLILASILLAGCGGSTGPSSVQPSHGGALLDLPNGAGFAEVLFEPDGPQATGKLVKGKVVAYFIDARGSAAPDPAPTDVSFTVEGGKSLPLVPKGGRYESASVSMPPGEAAVGTLNATIAGNSARLVNRPR